MEAIAVVPTPAPQLLPTLDTAPADGKPVKDPFWATLQADAAAKAGENPPAAAKPDAKAAAVEDDTPSEIKSEKGRVDWKAKKAELAEIRKAKDDLEVRLNTETGTLKEQKAELERQFNELKSKADPDAFEKLKQDHADVSLRLRVKDMTEDPQWQRAFVAPVNTAMKEALAMVPAELQKRAEWMLKQPDSEQRTEALEEMVGSLRPLAQSRFASAIAIIDGKRREADAILAEAPKYVEKFEASRRVHGETMANQAKVDRNRTFEAAVPKFAELPWADTPEEAAKVRQEAVATARSYYESGDPEAQARMSNWAAFGEKAEPRIKHLSSELAKANDLIKQLQGSKPGNSSVVPGGKNVAAEKDPFAASLRVS